jgi:phage terminase large subunit
LAFEVGLKLNEFYNLLPRQFNNCVAGYSKRQTESLKNSWEQTRQLMFAVLSPNLKDRSITASKIISFPWDEEEEKIDIAAEIEAVEDVKKHWAVIDAKTKKTEVFKI